MEPMESVDHFYEIHINMGKQEGYSVYFRSKNYISPEEVVNKAVESGDLLELYADRIDYVLEITPGEYYEHMDDE